MYTQFYGLREKPFSLSPDPRFLFLSDSHREALAHLLYGIEQGEGFIAITGEVGTGKTTLCRTLLRRLEPGTEVAFLFNPQLSAFELLQSICAELGLDPDQRTRRELNEQLNRLLLRKRGEGHRVLLIIDEAQTLGPEGLEQVRLLSNLETDTDKLLQILLIGQPELDAALESPGLRQLRQRIGVRWRLEPLSQAETRAYVRHRLRIAAGAAREIFSEPALREIHRCTSGIPRLINLLCDRALLAGYGAEARSIGLALVSQVHREMRSPTHSSAARRSRAHWARRLAPGLGALLGALAFVALGLWSQARPPWQRAPRPAPEGPADAGAAGGTLPAAPVSAAPPGAPPLRELPATSPEIAGPVEPLAPAAEAPFRPFVLGEALASQGPAETNARALDAILASWGRAPLHQSALSLAQAVAALQGAGFSLLRLRGATLDDLQEIDRPALLALDAWSGPQRLVLLQGVRGGEVTLVGLGDAPLRIPAEDLAWSWQGGAYVPWRDYQELPEILGPGAKGKAVRWLQHALASMGYYRGPETGRFDGDTLRAVRALQRDQHIEVDGIVGPVTKLRLYERIRGEREPRLGAGVRQALREGAS